MKNLFKLFFVVTLFFLGCDETTDPDNGGNGGGNSVTKIEGKLPSWTLGTGKEIKYGEWNDVGGFTSMGSSAVASDGSFSITLATPSASQLESISGSGGDTSCTNSMTANPSDTKVYGGNQTLAVFSGTNIIGVAYYGKVVVDTMQTLNDAAAIWVYVTKDVTANGSEVCNEEINGVWGKHTVTLNNLSFKSGWNKMYMTITSLTATALTRTITATEPSGLAWKFVTF